MSPKEFVQDVKDKAFVRQKGACAHCGDGVGVDTGYGHMKKPAELGGDTSLHNCVILCQKCHLQYGHIGKWAKFVITQDYPHFSADGIAH
jgi:5-methylcytosine-specific restriction endonuclease McrA